MKLLLALVLAAMACIVQVAAQEQSVPRTPAEAYERAKRPFDGRRESEHPGTETYEEMIREQERRAREYVRLFKPEDWRGKQLFDLGVLHMMAQLPEGAERAFTAYLRDGETRSSLPTSRRRAGRRGLRPCTVGRRRPAPPR